MKIVLSTFGMDKEDDKVLYDEKMGGMVEVVLSDGSIFYLKEDDYYGEPLLEIHSPTGVLHIFPRAANACNLQAQRR